MALQDKYKELIDTAKNSGVRNLQVSEQNNVLHVTGDAPNGQVKDALWNVYNKIDPDYRAGDLVLDVPSRAVSKAGRPVPLTRKEFEILLLLAQREGEVIPRDEFCDLIWGAEVFVTQRVIDTHVASLRKKIDNAGEGPTHILSVHGIGYKLE